MGTGHTYFIRRVERPDVAHAHNTAVWDVYECGHVRPPKQDIYGPTNAVRRRCGMCRDGRPADIDTADARIVPVRH